MPLRIAMRVVVAVCTVAPLAGAHAWLVATRRPRVWLLPAMPFAFGSLWHWGFLNFLLGTGGFLGGLALVVRAAERASRARSVALGALAVALLFTHFHGLVMLLLFAPVFAWAYAPGPGRAPYVRALAPLLPAALSAAAFVAFTWSQAEGAWARMNPGAERADRRASPSSSPAACPIGCRRWSSAPAVLVTAALGLALRGTRPSRALAARLPSAWPAQVAMYLLLPLNTNTATYVSARHALLVVLMALPLLPALAGTRAAGRARRRGVRRGGGPRAHGSTPRMLRPGGA